MTPATATTRHPIGHWLKWLVLPVLLAAATVMLISRTDRQEVDIAIAVSFSNLDETLFLMDRPRQSVKLLIAGTPSALATIDPQNTACRLDLAGLGQGTHSIPIRPEQVRLPPTITLTKILTPTLTIRLAPLVRQSAGVVAMLEGEAAPGFAVSAVHLKPDRITMEGTAAMLAGINTVKTRPINLEGASEPFKKEVALDLPEAIDVDPPLRIVLADVIVEERVVTRVLENISIAGKGASGSYRIHPQTITLTVSGPEVIVNSIETDPAFGVTVNLEGLIRGTYSLTAAINLPVRTTLLRVTPERFSVTIDN